MRRILRLGAPLGVCATCYFLDPSSPTTPATVVHAADNNLKLQHVQILFRHGARTPIWTLSNYSNIEAAVWDKETHGKQFETGLQCNFRLLTDGSSPTMSMYDDAVPTVIKGGCHTGQLTYLGQEELYALGKRFAQRYIHNEGLVSPNYPDPGVHFRSTYYERTVQSMMCFLAGMYSEGTVEGAIDVMTQTQDSEDLCGNLFGCPKFIKWYDHVFSAAARTKEENKAENHINEVLGKAADEPNATFLQLYDIVKCYRHHGFPVPPLLLQNESTVRDGALAVIQKLLGKDTETIRLSIGSYLDTVCNRIEDCIKRSGAHSEESGEDTKGSGGDNERPGNEKLVLYSAHDWTIISVLMSLGVNLKSWPPFASHFVVELYMDQKVGRYFVRVLYNYDVLMLGEGEEELVPVEKFLEILGVYRVSDFDAECGSL